MHSLHTCKEGIWQLIAFTISTVILMCVGVESYITLLESQNTYSSLSMVGVFLMTSHGNGLIV